MHPSNHHSCLWFYHWRLQIAFSWRNLCSFSFWHCKKRRLKI